MGPFAHNGMKSQVNTFKNIVKVVSFSVASLPSESTCVRAAE